jgi:hypothetical protein
MPALQFKPCLVSCKAGGSNNTRVVATRRNSAHRLAERSITMGLASAVLGPICDNFHSQHDVLRYHNPLHIYVPPILALETTWWTPILFAIAGIILGLGCPFLDGVLPQFWPRGGRNPLWIFVLANISIFVMLYWASAVLERPLLGVVAFGSLPAMDLTLGWAALVSWTVFDATPQGFLMASLTAVCGPLVEIVLINGGKLYHYAHPDVLGAVPSWIAWVYFAGGPAVSNLGRKVANEILTKPKD